MAVTLTLDDHVAKSVQWALEVTTRLGPWHRDMFPGVRVALDVLGPAIVEAEGRAARQHYREPFDPHASNAHDAVDDGWGNDGQ